MAVEHSTLTDPELHEPKGASTANEFEVYVSDGAQSGSWQRIQGPSIDSTGSTYGEILAADGNGSGDFGQLVWKDITGVFRPDSGVAAPSVALFRGTAIDGYLYAAGDSADWTFHVPHDWAVGTDMYLHVHYGHNGTGISGTTVWSVEAMASNRSAAAPFSTFSTPINTTIPNSATVNITNYPQYCHVVEEVQLSASIATAALLDRSLISVDGIIVAHVGLTTAPTVTGGSSGLFLWQVDLHYQAKYHGTKNKAPDFYA